MNNILEYKGYHAKITFDCESKTLHGYIDGIRDYIDFLCDDPKKVEEEFHSAVDEYLEFCKEVGKEPEKEFKGSFNVRISPDLHREIATCAFLDQCSLNSEIEKALTYFVKSQQRKRNRKASLVGGMAANG